MYNSLAMQTVINDILGQNIRTEFVVELSFTNAENSSFTYAPLFIDSMNIEQDYTGKLCDDIKVTFKAKPEDYMALFDNRTNLRATLKITYVDPNTNGGQYDYTTPPTVKTYLAHMLSPKDLRATAPQIGVKTYPQVVDSENPRVPVSIQLVNKAVYDSLHQQYTATYKNGTILALIHGILVSYGITQCEIIPPDNVNKYAHFSLPPGKDLHDIFEYIQKTWGIYMKGVGYYYDDTCFYMWPEFDNEPVTNNVMNVYNSFKGMYAAVPSYHKIQGTTISIVTTGTTDTKDLSKSGSENQGTGTAFLRASCVLDGYATTDHTGTHINQNNSLLVTSPNPLPVNTNANVVKYKGSTDNIFEVSSELAEMQAKIITTSWGQSIPFTFKPGQRVFYYNDNNGVFEKSSGILMAARYNVKQGNKIGMGPTYRADCQLKFRINPTPTTS